MFRALGWSAVLCLGLALGCGAEHEDDGGNGGGQGGGGLGGFAGSAAPAGVDAGSGGGTGSRSPADARTMISADARPVDDAAEGTCPDEPEGKRCPRLGAVCAAGGTAACICRFDLTWTCTR